MHEMALSQQIVRTALQAASEQEEPITGISVSVGALSATNVDSLSFWMEEVLCSRGMEKTEVEIERVPARMECECGCTYEAEDMFAGCPECGSHTREILSGKDVTVQWVEVGDNGEKED